MREAGLLSLTAARGAGAHDVDLRTLVRVVAELGRGCPSTAWVTGLSAAGKTLALSLLPKAARDALLNEPDVILCSSSVPEGHGQRVSSGLRLSGRWRMASGSEVAAWALLFVPVRQEEHPLMCPVLVPTSDLTVERTWQAVGLSGTSSHTLVADDVLVSEDHVTFPPEGASSALPSAELTFVAGLAVLAPFLGATRGAQDVVATALADGRAPFGTKYERVVDSPLGRYWFTEAVQGIDSATERALRVADALDAVAVGDTLPITERARLRMELTSAARGCREAVEGLLDLHGSTGFVMSNPLQRFWRDVAVGTRHPYFTPYIVAEDYGRVALDVESPVLRVL